MTPTPETIGELVPESAVANAQTIDYRDDTNSWRNPENVGLV
jgi:hypothetical protein